MADVFRLHDVVLGRCNLSVGYTVLKEYLNLWEIFGAKADELRVRYGGHTRTRGSRLVQNCTTVFHGK